MAQTPFNPTPGVSTHQDCVDTINANVTDAEARLVSLESNPEPTLESVTSNGATTTNNITVGTIATLHPTNAANNNAATGTQSASIGGRRNTASGTRATTFGGTDNTVSGTDSTAVGGNNQDVIGVESEALGSTNLVLNTKYTSALGTANSVVGLATSPATSVEAKHSVIVGGEQHTIEDAAHAVILGGEANTVRTTDDRSVILGGTNITTDASDTAYVQNLNIKSAVKIPTGAVDTYVLTSDTNGVGTWQAANNHTHTISDIDSALAADGTVATADGAGNVTWEVGGGGAAAFSVVSVTTASYAQTTEHTNHLYDDTLLTPGGGGSGGEACMIVDLLPVAQHVGVTIHKKIGDSCDIELVAPVGSTIDGAASYLLTSQYEAISIFTDGTNYFVQ